MSTPTKIWRHDDGVLPNLLAFAYVACGHLAGLWLLTRGAPLAWVAGVLLTGHSLIVAGYLMHDLAHLCVFADKRLNLAAAEILSWFGGAAYAPMSHIQRMHVRHHADRADLTIFDARPFLAAAPGWVRRLVYLLEWCYVPAVELIMHYQIVLRPFVNPAFRDQLPRVLFVGATRLAFFAALFALSPWALPGYAIAYMIFVTALFLADAYAHTYEFFVVSSIDEKVPRDGREGDYDKYHTYSNVISERWPWLNLLNLNFGYHNVHHERPTAPWYRLPQLHRETWGDEKRQVLPYRAVWRSFRRNRLKRIEATDFGEIGSGPDRADAYLGAHGVSFITIV